LLWQCQQTSISVLLSACSPDISKLSWNKILVLSDEIVDAEAAQQKCGNLGGELVSTSNETTNSTFQNALAKYTKGLS